MMTEKNVAQKITETCLLIRKMFDLLLNHVRQWGYPIVINQHVR